MGIAEFIVGPAEGRTWWLYPSALCDRTRDGSLTVGKLVFGDDTLDLVRLDAISKTSVRLDGHALNDGVNFLLLDLHATLRTLTAMQHGCV
jgi:hypothetical protein